MLFFVFICLMKLTNVNKRFGKRFYNPRMAVADRRINTLCNNIKDGYFAQVSYLK